MPGYFEASNRPGVAKWLRVQYQEEWEHAKFLDFVDCPG
jgi:ferritin